jgi:predicted N-acetyltransferase YhbS
MGSGVVQETAAHIAAIRDINLRAFGRPDEAALVDALRRDGLVIASLVAEEHGVGGRVCSSAAFDALS